MVFYESISYAGLNHGDARWQKAENHARRSVSKAGNMSQTCKDTEKAVSNSPVDKTAKSDNDESVKTVRSQKKCLDQISFHEDDSAVKLK